MSYVWSNDVTFEYLGHTITFNSPVQKLHAECSYTCPNRLDGQTVLICSVCPHEHYRTMPHWANHDARQLELRQIAFEHAVTTELHNLRGRVNLARLS